MTETRHLNRFFQEAVIQAVPCAVFAVDTNERIIFWNKPVDGNYGQCWLSPHGDGIVEILMPVGYIVDCCIILAMAGRR